MEIGTGLFIGLVYFVVVCIMIFAAFTAFDALTEQRDSIYLAKSFCLNAGYTKHAYGKSFGNDSGEFFCINEGTGEVAETIYYYSRGQIGFRELEVVK